MMTGTTANPGRLRGFPRFTPAWVPSPRHEKTAPAGLPAYFSIPEMSQIGGPNFLGAKYAPFVVSDNPNTPGFRVRDVALPQGLSEGRFDTRREVRVQVDRMVRFNEKITADPVGRPG